MSNVSFLRGRAEVYRRMARSTLSQKTAADFMRLAADCEERAAVLESELPQLRISIRRHPIAPRQQALRRSA